MASLQAATEQGAGVVKRWDGAARTCYEWNSLRKDPELWFRKGDCLVYLHGKGRSRRGPAFKVSFASLLSTRCYGLVQRFLVTDGPVPRRARDLERWYRHGRKQTLELYIPSPSTANQQQTLRYHLATRNLFAWIFRRSLVGEHLGGAMVSLLHSMHEFRAPGEDNVQDLLAYMDEEGYLELSGQPNHALAALHLAECAQVKDLYVRSFAHTVGMAEKLHQSTEYEHIGFTTKDRIRMGRAELDTRVHRASDMLKALLDEELSETHLGIPEGNRAHLERFRSFLMSFYTSHFGYYPPRVFDSEALRTMREDFDALYDLLVDTRCSMAEDVRPLAIGGLCTLQLVETFDNLQQFETLDQPLPLLPQFKQPATRKPTWLSRSEKVRPEQRLMAHAALIKATNWKDHIFQNSLVTAYRQFEEDSIFEPNRADKTEKVSVQDARKVRWLLIYSIYQVLRSVTEEPPEVLEDFDASYHLAISTSDLPPWGQSRETCQFARRQTDIAAHSSPIWKHPSSSMPILSEHAEIKPDIDYFALTHKEPERGRQTSLPPISAIHEPAISRGSSLSRALSRSSTLRSTMKLFKPPSPTSSSAPAASIRPAYHEIVVHGYGNGTNNVNFDSEPSPEPSPEPAVWPTRSDSTASQSDASIDSPPGSTVSASTIDSPDSIKTPSPTKLVFTDLWADKPTTIEDLPPAIPPRRSSISFAKRPMSLVARTPSYSSSEYSGDAAVEAEPPEPPQRRHSFFARTQSLRLNSKPGALLNDLNLRRRSYIPESLSTPLTLRRRRSDISEEPRVVSSAGSDDWTSLQQWLDVERAQLDAKPAWEQYADLGGLTDLR